jgi:hypothetical protein
MDAEIPGVKQVNRQFTAVRPGLPLSHRPSLKFPQLSPILDLMQKRRNARFIHPFQQDSAYDQSITDAFFIAAFFCD